MDNTIFEPLLKHKKAAVILERFRQKGNEIRFVGGAVRDCLARRKIKDIDLATPLTPEAVMSSMEEIGLKVIPTGIDHGTVTVVVDEQNFEITTLRKDVETNGRRAVVQYTHDWYEDALRRDFTFNAMSLRPDGSLFDPFSGVQDLEEGRVVFIGNAEDRIEEDVLRILRFFRFHAFYGKGRPNRTALAACIELRGLLDQLSAERVRQEVFKIMSSPKVAEVWHIMQDNAILAHILPHATDIKTLINLVNLESKVDLCSPIRRILSLYKRDSIVLSDMVERLRLTKIEKARTGLLKQGVVPEFLSCSDTTALLPYLYRYGRRVVLDGLLINQARGWGDSITDDQLKDCIHTIQNWQRPQFPLSGADLINHFGMKEGPEIGVFLKDIEDYWLEKECKPSREELLVQAKDLFEKPGSLRDI